MFWYLLKCPSSSNILSTVILFPLDGRFVASRLPVRLCLSLRGGRRLLNASTPNSKTNGGFRGAEGGWEGRAHLDKPPPHTQQGKIWCSLNVTLSNINMFVNIMKYLYLKIALSAVISVYLIPSLNASFQPFEWDGCNCYGFPLLDTVNGPWHHTFSCSEAIASVFSGHYDWTRTNQKPRWCYMRFIFFGWTSDKFEVCYSSGDGTQNCLFAVNIRPQGRHRGLSQHRAVFLRS